MKSIKQRTKNKKNNAKFGRVKLPNKDSSDAGDPDSSQLRKPVDISVSSLTQVTKLLETGSEEVKSILSYECDIIYECRICRSLFRSLANFISHKRVYCREKFNIAHCKHLFKDRILTDEMLVSHAELAKDWNCKETDNHFRTLRSQAFRQTLKKDITSVLHKLQQKNDAEYSDSEKKTRARKTRKSIRNQATESPTMPEQQDVLLEAIEDNPSAVYQTAIPSSATKDQPGDMMKAQIKELETMIEQNTAILTPDGKLLDTKRLTRSKSLSKLYDSDDEEESSTDPVPSQGLVCNICNAKFSTRKTLTFHMKSLHTSHRMCYPCPCCDSMFVNTWSVYRHLFKVHRKSNEQVRKLRNQIQEKAFRRGTSGAEDIERERELNKSTSALEQGTANDEQEWMDHLEFDLEFQRCSGCGRRFDRRAALIAHSQLCLKRITACNEAAGKTKRTAKTPSPDNLITIENNNLPSTGTPAAKPAPEMVRNRRKQSFSTIECRPPNEQPQFEVIPVIEPKPNTEETEIAIRVDKVAKISDADWEMLMLGVNPDGSPMDEEDLSVQSNSTSNVTSKKVKANQKDDHLQSDSKHVDIPRSFDVGVKCQRSPDSTHVTIPRAASTVPNDHSLIKKSAASSAITMVDSPEIIYTSVDKERRVAISFGPKKRRISLVNDVIETEVTPTNCSNERNENSAKNPTPNPTSDTPDNATPMEERMAMITNLRKLQCLVCRKKFTSMPNLRRHMAIHIGWNRFRCKLCDFKCFHKCDCVAHCNRFHDAKNNRAVIADMVVQIEPDQSFLCHESILDDRKSDNENLELEVIDVSAPSTESNFVSESVNNANQVNGEQTETIEKIRESPEKNVIPESNEVVISERKEVVPDSQKLPDKSLDTSENLIVEREEPTKEALINDVENQLDGRMDENRDLRRMVMEVIFGSGEKEANGETSICRKPMKAKSTDSDVRKLDDNRSQRPARNRVKPVHEDFFYPETNRAEPSSVKFTRKKQSTRQQTPEAECKGNLKCPRAPIVRKLTTCKVPSVVLFKHGV